MTALEIAHVFAVAWTAVATVLYVADFAGISWEFNL